MLNRFFTDIVARLLSKEPKFLQLKTNSVFYPKEKDGFINNIVRHINETITWMNIFRFTTPEPRVAAKSLPLYVSRWDVAPIKTQSAHQCFFPQRIL